MAQQKQSLLLLLWQLIIIILFLIFVDYEPTYNSATNEGASNRVSNYYVFYSHVATMALVGFGYLMTFVRRYRFGAVGYTFLVTVLIFQWSVLCLGFWERVQNGKWEKIHMSMVLMIDAMFAACSCLIALGGMLGKVSIWQFLFLSFWQTIVYTGNYILGAKVIKAVDIGGSMFIHMFGAYWGLAAAWWINPSDMRKRGGYKAQGASYSSDTFAMIGTFFLWLLWPSFNGALAPAGSQARVIINTVLSLTASAMVSFGLSAVLRPEHKLTMEDIQNATLAGGVAVGSSADLVISPGGALLVGLVSGAWSVFGYVKVTPFLYEKFGLHDTCGIHNLHGVPGIIGALAGIISAGTASSEVYGQQLLDIFPHATAGDQWKYQLACLGHSFGIAIVGGFIFGWITHKLGPCLFDPHVDPEYMFDDSHSWEVPHVADSDSHHELKEKNSV